MARPLPRRGAAIALLALALQTQRSAAQLQDLSLLLEAGRCAVALAAGEEVLGETAAAGACWLQGARQPAVLAEAPCAALGVCSDAGLATAAECAAAGSCSDPSAATEAECAALLGTEGQAQPGVWTGAGEVWTTAEWRAAAHAIAVDTSVGLRSVEPGDTYVPGDTYILSYTGTPNQALDERICARPPPSAPESLAARSRAAR